LCYNRGRKGEKYGIKTVERQSSGKSGKAIRKNKIWNIIR
jgi:hypothetical protein